MLKFKTIKIIKPNDEIHAIIKNYKYKIIKSKIKTLSSSCVSVKRWIF